VNALLEDDQYERLRRAAFETRRPMTDILREALEDWLNRYESDEGSSSG
jgi:predicted DNA-binding protein